MVGVSAEKLKEFLAGKKVNFIRILKPTYIRHSFFPTFYETKRLSDAFLTFSVVYVHGSIRHLFLERKAVQGES